MCIKENIQKVIDEFLFIESWEERYEHLISLGKKLPKMPKTLRKKNYLIIGCQSKVWLRAYIKFNKIFFHIESDALVPKGVSALIVRIYSGQFPIDIIHTTPLFIYNIGFSSFLTSNRANGMDAIYRAIKKYAIYFQ